MNDAAASALRDLLGERFSTSPSILGLHGRDESRFAPREPDAVAFANTTEEVSAILRICSEHGVPVIPWGAGSSLEGHVLPVHGGVALDLTGMDRVLEVNAEDLDCRVEAGVHRLALEKRLGQDGLFFAVDPGADATLGGMAATAASGTRTTRYGTMRENVLGLRAVLADGTVIDTGSRARKSSAGYDLTRLLLGSEGTLAVICELTLRIHGIPEEIAAARCVFEDLAGAVATVTEAVQLGIPMARCELLDPAAIRAVNAHDELSEPEAYTLFLEFHGGPASVAEQVESVREIAGSPRRRRLRLDDDHRRAQPALARPPQRLLRRHGHAAGDDRAQTTDVCVPVSRLAESITASAADAAELPFPAAMVGHVADGNYHWICPVDTDSEAEQAALAALRGADGHARPAGRRDVHGRARRRARQARGAARPGRAGGDPDDARAQAGARPGRDPQPGEGPPGRLKRAAHQVISTVPSRIVKRRAAAGGAAIKPLQQRPRRAGAAAALEPVAEVERERGDLLALELQAGVRAERPQALQRQRRPVGRVAQPLDLGRPRGGLGILVEQVVREHDRATRAHDARQLLHEPRGDRDVVQREAGDRAVVGAVRVGQRGRVPDREGRVLQPRRLAPRQLDHRGREVDAVHGAGARRERAGHHARPAGGLQPALAGPRVRQLDQRRERLGRVRGLAAVEALRLVAELAHEALIVHLARLPLRE